MVILPKIQIKRGAFPGNHVLIQLSDLSQNEKTFLSADEASGQTTLSVLSGVNFVANEYVVIGTPGQEHTELKLVSSQTTTTVVVASTDFAHPRGTPVTFIPFNRIQVQDDTDSSFGSPTTTTVNLRVDSLQTFLEDTDGLATTNYRARFEHEQGNRQSLYSDVIIATGYANNTVYAVKKRALQSVGYKIGQFDWLTDDWLNTALWEGRRELEAQLDRWSFRKNFETDIGNVQQGQHIISAPTNLRENTTSKNILAIYVGPDRILIRRRSKQFINEWYRGVAHTTLSSSLSDSATSASLTNSRDFTESGSVDIVGAAVTATLTGTIDPATSTTVIGLNTLFLTEVHEGDYLVVTGETRRVTSIASDTSLTVATVFSDNANDISPDVIHIHTDGVDYTDNLISSNELNGLTNIQHGGHASGEDVWQGASFGLPQFFTVTDDGIMFSQPFHTDYHDENIFADYWGTFTDLDSDADVLDEVDYDMFVNYLAYRIKKRKAKGQLPLTDDDYVQWLQRSQALIERERHEQDVFMFPDISHLDAE